VFYLINTMKAFLIPVFVFLFAAQSFAQSGYVIIADEICDSVSARCMDKDSATVINLEQSFTLAAVLHHPEISDSINKSIRNEFPDLNATSVSGIFSKRLVRCLIINCESYVQVTQRIASGSVPEKESLRLVSSEICQLIENSTKTTMDDFNEIIDENLFPLMLKYQKEIAADYTDGYANPDFMDDQIKYQMKHCPVLFKAMLMKEFK